MIVYNKTNIGYSHVEKNVVCQDYSEKYVDDNYVIITACDGHGGDIYIRSDRGSKFASQAIIDVFKSYDKQELESIITGNNLNKTKLQILCRWNELIERDYSIENFTDDELKQLDDEQVFKLEHNFVIAYGTTLNAAILFQDYIICLQIGDGGVFLFNDDKLELAFPDNNENVANITYSLCGDKAYEHLFIGVFNKNDWNGVFVCTDGLLGPYQTYKNLKYYFLDTIIKLFSIVTIETFDIVDKFIIDLAMNIGSGDDVSFSLIHY